jgi:glycosyltransferase involved in cell wall biosynthesis
VAAGGGPAASPSRVALVHDYLLVRRGAERTFEAVAECWPEAPIYTLLYDEEGTEGRFAGREVRTSYLQRLGLKQRGFRALLPAFPRAIRSLPLDAHDLVVSSSSAFAHGVRIRADARHVCYCHSPFRYAWFERERALEEVARPLRPLLRRTLDSIRAADLAASRSVTRYVANSVITQQRIDELWDRSASVVHPPVEVERFRRTVAGDRFLVVTELVRHKRVELALAAAKRAGAGVDVVGEGPDRERLQSRYGGARFLGRVGDAELAELYGRARALILPNVEEFGIAAVEAQAAGRPVVAVAAGGALETVVEGETGVLVAPGDVDALTYALRDTDFSRFEPGRIVALAQRFSKAAFQRRLREQVRAAEQSVSPAQAVGAAASTLS